MMNHTQDRVTFLGVRGSTTVSGQRFLRYGGSTTCVLVVLGGQPVLLDAGSGLMNIPRELMGEPALPLLLSHPHLDHLIGLPMCPFLFRREARLDIYGAGRCGESLEQSLDRAFSPPLWPVSLRQMDARVTLHELSGPFTLGKVLVEPMEGAHSGGVTLFRLTCGGKRVVFASDCTITEELRPRLADFARDCDLLMIDGQYSEEEWPRVSTFGHSTWRMAAELGELSRAKGVYIVHHAPGRGDEDLDAAQEDARRACPRCVFAREGETVAL